MTVRTFPTQGTEHNGMLDDYVLSAGDSAPDTEVDKVFAPPPSSGLGLEAEAAEHLLSENVALRERLAELEKVLEEKLRSEQTWAEREKEHEALLEEKSEVIRELHLKLQERTEPAAPREAAALPGEEELLALSEELETERRQLHEDEEALKTQMREMEVQMSRERAELARQRNDLQRLHNEIRHELELVSRNAALRDRLQPLQRRHQELLNRKGAQTLRDGSSSPGVALTNGAAEGAPGAQPSAARDGSNGLLRRLFG